MNDNNHSHDIFISYSRKNKDIVLPIKDEIERTLGLRCWIDLSDIPCGSENFKRKVIPGIRQTRIAFLFFLSAESQTSEYAIKEIGFASKRANKRVILIRFNDDDMTDEFYFDFQNADIIDWRVPEQKMKLLYDLRAWAEGLRLSCQDVGVLHEKIQLWAGGPYWATTNIGADKPEDCGLYFMWGDTTGHRPTGENFRFSFDEANCPTCSKSIATLQREGRIVPKNGTYVFAPAHDAAQVQWGGDWRMPTHDELEALNNNCDWTWTTKNGVNGYDVRGRGSYASNRIFLPCAGYGYGTSLDDAGLSGYYWSSIPESDSDYYYSWNLGFCSSDHGTDYSYRFLGYFVRPVQGFAK